MAPGSGSRRISGSRKSWMRFSSKVPKFCRKARSLQGVVRFGVSAT